MTVLNIVLSHQPPHAVAETLRHWANVCDQGDLLLAYGGPESNFRLLAHEPKVFIADPRLRTRDHQREQQSYSAIFKAAHHWMTHHRHPATFVHFAEYDHVPLLENVNARQVVRLQEEGADFLGYHLSRIDGTSHPHYLYHAAHPEFQSWLSAVSVRSEKEVVLAMLATGSFWTRDCFDAVATEDEPFPIYVEVYLPTLAHHLGFRGMDYREQNQFVSHRGEHSRLIAAARSSGAWTLHPVKQSATVEQLS